jgi:gamma-glutamylcyclotransferase (GGCT)/AIG2-like uncharacterized protein YtfP
VTPVRLFVYGSLRRGAENHHELGAAVFLGLVNTAPRYGIVRVGAYPALVAGSTAIAGELYELEHGALRALDAFEGPGYRRALVQLEGGGDAEAYFLVEAMPR